MCACTGACVCIHSPSMSMKYFVWFTQICSVHVIVHVIKEKTLGREDQNKNKSRPDSPQSQLVILKPQSLSNLAPSSLSDNKDQNTEQAQ